MTQQYPIAVAKNGRNNPDRTGVVSGDRHRHILTMRICRRPFAMA
jgi:hypothetical protein